MRRRLLASVIVLLFLLQTTVSVRTDLVSIQTNNSFHQDTLFNQTGFAQDGVYTNSTGEVHVNRPHIQWLTPTDGPIMTRTGACSVSIDSLDEVWLMGGWTDPDPQAQNDEGPTDLIEIMRNNNKSWEPSAINLPHAQQYCEAEVAGNLVVVVGEWFRNSNPPQQPTGRVQIYNLDNNTWYNGSSMPSNNERGLGAMAEANGFLYYAGGVRNSNANDATNKTYRYDPQNDTWTRMADMNHERASFELINFHGQLYAMGGFKGTQTWNRQALDYVERYDPATNIWTNLSKLPVGMFGWTGTVLNDEIVLVGGYNGGTKSTVYHWNPIEDTWSKGNDIGYIGHFDTAVEEINGSIIWASGDMSSYAYSSWNQLVSQDSEYQNKSNSHTAWVTSSIIDLKPSNNAKATPVQLHLQGNNTPGGELQFQYRAATSFNGISSQLWEGPDGTINSTFPAGITNVNLSTHADFIQYRIKFVITDLESWDQPNLDSMSVRTEHAGFVSSIPVILHPRGETFQLQTSHDKISLGEMYVEIASCDEFGAIDGSWSRVSHDGATSTTTDMQGLFINSFGTINSTDLGETLIDWEIDLGDLTDISHVCLKVGTTGEKTTEFVYSNPVEIDNVLEVRITDLGQLESQDTISGGIPVNIGINHSFLSTGMTLSSGNLQARLNFDIEINDLTNNSANGWLNQTTPWTSLTAGGNDVISWSPPTDISGNVSISLDARSDQSLQILTNSNSSYLILDNDNPLMIGSIPESGGYFDSTYNRDISIQIADTSGFNSEQVAFEIWVQAIDDGSDGSFPDSIPQTTEYREINFTMQNNGAHWWFNGSQSDKENSDQQLVYARIVGTDNAGLALDNNTIWWKTRDAQNAFVDRIYNEDGTQFWEVSRDVSWNIVITDSNALSDIISVKIELGGVSEFGISYDVADSICTSLGAGINTDKTHCNHSFIDDEMVLSVNIFSDWNVDTESLNQGLVEIHITDIDGVSQSTFQNLWIFSDAFDFSISQVNDTSGTVTGEISNTSIMQTNDILEIKGAIAHSLSGESYQGELSMTWSGLLQGQEWFGSSAIEVNDGEINSTIAMPSTGGILDFEITFMDPIGTRTIGTYQLPTYIVDANYPVILDSSISQLSRYHLDDVGIGVNIDEDVSWSNELSLTCQVISSEIEWEEVTISILPSNVFQGKTLFSFEFDFSSLGNPSLLSPEARVDCWAFGQDDSGWNLETFDGSENNEPWLSIPLSTEGPNIELLDVALDGTIESGKELRAEITIRNSGEDLEDSFNITVYTIIGDEKTLIGKFSQSQISSGEGITKRVAITIPDGDWELLVIVDEEQNIWELNEDDNSFNKKYTTPEETNSIIYIGSGMAIIVLILFVIVRKKKSPNEMSEAKNLPKIEDLPRSGPPKKSQSINSTKPKRGPPPKPKTSDSMDQAKSVADAIAKLSIQNVDNTQDHEMQKVPSYESLPGGGNYEYISEGTFYTGEGIGRWKLEADGSFSKIE